MEKPVLIIGAKALGINVLEILLANDVLVYGFLDDDASLHHTDIHGVPVMGSTSDEKLLKAIGSKAEVCIAVENAKERAYYAEIFLEDYKAIPINVIHPRAQVSKFASLGHGNILLAHAVLNSYASIGYHNIVGSNVFVDAGVKIGDFCFIGANTCLNSGVEVLNNVYLGTGVCVVSDIKIGKNARVGAGSVVMADVKTGQTVFGVPAIPKI